MEQNTELQFRKAKQTDHQKIVEFQIAMALETENLNLDRHVCEKGVKAIFENPHYGEYFILEKNGSVISSLLIIPEWSDWRNGVVWWIHSVYVLPVERMQGVFSYFYKKIQSEGLKISSFRGLRLYVDRTNVSAQKVYERLGMSNHHYELYEWMRK